MKTAISIPDEIFEAADALAARRGISRSELYARAVSDWVERHRDDRVTERLDAVYGTGGDSGALEPLLSTLQLRSIKRRR